MSSLGSTNKYGKRKYLIAASAVLVVDFTLHDCDWYLIRNIKEKMRSVKSSTGHSNNFFEEFNASRVQKLSEMTKSQSEKINVVVGPCGVGKSTILTEFMYQKSAITLPIDRAAFIVRIGNMHNNGKGDDLTIQLFESIGFPTRSSLVGLVRDGIIRWYNNVRDIHQESAESVRLDYATDVFFHAIEDIHRENCRLITTLSTVGRKTVERAADDFDSCRPMLVVDEGDVYPVTTPGHDARRRELTRKFIRATIYHATKRKNFETWLTGRDGALIEEICVKNKSIKYPFTKYNTIVLDDVEKDVVRAVFADLLLYDNIGKEVKYDSYSVDRVIEVLGTRVDDLMESRILTSFHTPEQLETKLNEFVHRADKAIQTLFDACVNDEERVKLTHVLNQLSTSVGTVPISTLDLPQSVRANREAFEHVFFTAFDVIALQKNVTKYAWRKDCRAKLSLNCGKGGGVVNKSWVKYLLG